MRRAKIQDELGLRGEDNFRALYLYPALESGHVEMTIPDKPGSSWQKYRLTFKGEALKKKLIK